MDFKQFLHLFFVRREDFAKLTDKQKASCAFLLNRTFAKKFPTNANLLNGIKIDQISVVNYWFTFAARYRSQPSWFFLPSNVNKHASKNDNVAVFASFHKMTPVEVRFLEKHYPQEFSEEVAQIREYIRR